MTTILTAVAATSAQEEGETTVALDDAARAAAIEWRRAQIGPVPGSGSVLGSWLFNGVTYAFRNSASGAEAQMWKETTSGWEKIEFGWELDFDAGTSEITSGLVLTGGTSGATATVRKVVVQSGDWSTNDAAGYLVLYDLDGQFQNNETITDSSTGSATSNGIQSKTKLSPGGRYEFVNYNFRGHSGSLNMYFADGVNKAHEFDGTYLYPIRTGMTTDTPKFIVAHKYHLFLSFTGGSIQHSSIGNPFGWNIITGAGELALGDECTGFAVEVGDVLSIYVRNDVYFLYGTSSSDWELKRLHQGSGAVPYTLQKIGFTWGLDDRGITSVVAADTYGDFQQSTVSAKIQAVIDKYINATQSSLRVRSKNQYRLYFTDKQGLSLTFHNNRVIGMMLMDMTHQFNCTYSCEDEDGIEVLLAGGDNGYVYRLDSGTSHDGEDLNAFVRTAYHHYGNPDVLKVFRGVSLEFDSDSNETLSVACDFNYGATDEVPEALVFGGQVYAQGGFWNVDSWNEFYWSAPVVSRGRIRVNGVGQTMSVVMYSSTKYKEPIVLQGISVEYANRGLRR